jgi:hypothetical protein
MPTFVLTYRNPIGYVPALVQPAGQVGSGAARSAESR